MDDERIFYVGPPPHPFPRAHKQSHNISIPMFVRKNGER